jgi:hypothetical protein
MPCSPFPNPFFDPSPFPESFEDRLLEAYELEEQRRIGYEAVLDEARPCTITPLCPRTPESAPRLPQNLRVALPKNGS